jgi:YHS domain-containing protein
MKQIPSNQKNRKTQAVAIKDPMDKIYQLSISVVVLLLLSLLLLSCSDKKKDVAKSPSQTTVEASKATDEAVVSAQNYEIVPNDKVCMVNDRFMGVPQIAIEANDTTYYGCCENCIEKLQKNLDDVRFGSNPLNKTKVDKASAVIVQDKNSGNVFYFASKEDAQAFINKNKA